MDNELDLTTESFKLLQQSATSVEDVRQWLSKHPQVLLGVDVGEFNAHVDISLTLDPNILAKSFNTESLSATLWAKFGASLRTPDLLKNALGLDLATAKPEFTLANSLEFKLKDWHFATAILTSRYLSVQSARRSAKRANANWVVEKERLLDAMLSIHFPGMTMATLFNFVQNDLLLFGTNSDGSRDHSQVIAHLYTARQQHTPVVLPQEFM